MILASDDAEHQVFQNYCEIRSYERLDPRRADESALPLEWQAPTKHAQNGTVKASTPKRMIESLQTRVQHVSLRSEVGGTSTIRKERPFWTHVCSRMGSRA